MSQEHSNLSPDMINDPSAPSIFLQSARLPSATLALGCTPSTSASRQLENSLCTFSLCSNSAEALRKKMSQARISLMAGRMSRKLKYYGDLQLLPIPTHCRKGTSYDLILVIINWRTRWVNLSMDFVTDCHIHGLKEYQSRFDPCWQSRKVVHSKPAQISRYTRAGRDNFRHCNSIPRSPRLSNRC